MQMKKILNYLLIGVSLSILGVVFLRYYLNEIYPYHAVEDGSENIFQTKLENRFCDSLMSTGYREVNIYKYYSYKNDKITGGIYLLKYKRNVPFDNTQKDSILNENINLLVRLVSNYTEDTIITNGVDFYVRNNDSDLGDCKLRKKDLFTMSGFTYKRSGSNKFKRVYTRPRDAELFIPSYWKNGNYEDIKTVLK